MRFVFDGEEDDMRCGRCNGRGTIAIAGVIADNMVGTVGREACHRCLGAGEVNSNRLASALEAFRWCRERARERDALATIGALIDDRMTSGWWAKHRGGPVMLRRLFVDVDLVRDTLEEASAGGTILRAGPASWVADRWASVALDYDVDIARRVRFQRSHVAFWREVCPAVVDYVTVVDELPLVDPRAPALPGVA